MSLARLLGDGDRSSEARELLSDACGGFHEGFDFPDLRTAHALLESFGH